MTDRSKKCDQSTILDGTLLKDIDSMTRLFVVQIKRRVQENSKAILNVETQLLNQKFKWA